jgi:hypothetical protein
MFSVLRNYYFYRGIKTNAQLMTKTSTILFFRHLWKITTINTFTFKHINCIFG